MDVIALTAGDVDARTRVDVDPARGGRIVQIVVSGQELLADPGEPDGRSATSTGWGSYPMAPWAGRIRHGRFQIFGREHQLPCNQRDGDDPIRHHAMHGTVFNRRWEVVDRHPHAVTLTCRLDAPGSGWPWPGSAMQTIEVLDGQLCCDLSIEVDHHARAAHAFPGEVGWHPWFVKPDMLHFHPDAMYERDEIGLPTGRLVEPGAPPWDDCFVNTAPVTLEYRRDDVPSVTVSSDCDHWVIYDMPDHATCVEPQSGPPDAVTIRPRLVTTTRPLRRTMNISW